jgi:hypothetical protein
MIEAGFRSRTLIVQLEPEKAARKLARRFQELGLWDEFLEQIAEMAKEDK